MERIEDAAQHSSENIFIPASVKQEPESESETVEEDMNYVFDHQVIKAELKDDSDDTDAAMCDKFEACDPETAGRGVDGGLRGRLKKEETSPDSEGKVLFWKREFCFCFFRSM